MFNLDLLGEKEIDLRHNIRLLENDAITQIIN